MTAEIREKMLLYSDLFFKDRQIANKHRKRCSTSLIIRELQITTVVRYHLTPVRRTVIKNLQMITAREGVEKREASYSVGGNGNPYSCYRRQYGDSFKS